MKIRIKDEKKFITSISISLILIILLIVFIVTLPKEIKYTQSYKTITVLEKETLWNIAEEYKKPNQDIRDYIYQIKELNNMDSAMIYEGQELIIILYEEVK